MTTTIGSKHYTRIDWTGRTWNPVTGCTRASEGCQHCYAERMAGRLKLMGQDKYADGFAVTTHESCLDEPKHWRKPQAVFVCSMGDLFHEDVPDDFIKRVFEVMNDCPQHTFQVLTKRADRLARLASELKFTDNIWVGVSVESIRYEHRVDSLRKVPAHVRFLSCEPLLGSLEGIDLAGIDWVIVGGESGPGARPMDAEWARELRDLCEQEGVAFFFKQQGAKQGKGIKTLDGVTYHQYPNQAA